MFLAGQARGILALLVFFKYHGNKKGAFAPFRYSVLSSLSPRFAASFFRISSRIACMFLRFASL
jgi:hypothetical protein